MNEYNVAAIAGALTDYLHDDEVGTHPEFLRQIAEGLAARGVLVPSALPSWLTDSIYPEPLTREGIVELLEQIARGESAVAP